MPVLPGTQINIRNCQTNYKFARTNALDFAYPWETDLILGLVSSRVSRVPVIARLKPNVTII